MAIGQFDILDAYWVAGTNPTTQVFSTAAGVEDFVANNAAAYQTWLAAGNFGTLRAITAESAGAAGTVRLTLDASQLQTGQRAQIAGLTGSPLANGFCQFNLIDATHIDLVGTTFVATASPTAATLAMAAIVATDAALAAIFDAYAQKTYIGSALVSTVTANVVLTNPCPDNVFITQNGAAGNTITLPKVLTPRAPPIGRPIYIRLISSVGIAPRFQLLKNFSGTTLSTMDTAGDLIVRLTSNAIAGGTWVVDYRSPPSIGQVQGLRGVRTGTATMTFSFDRAVAINYTGSPLFLRAASGLTCDLTLSGLGGQDATVAGGADVHFYLVARQDVTTGPFIVASGRGPNDLITPSLPAVVNSYDFMAYLCTLRTKPAVTDLYDFTARGREVFYNAPVADSPVGTGLTNSNATPNTSRTVSTWVPACASSYRLRVKGSGVSGAYSALIGINTGVIFADFPIAASGVGGGEITMPGATAFFQSNSTGAANSTDIHVLGYSCPSGDT